MTSYVPLWLSTKPFYRHLNCSSPLLPFNPLRNNTVLNKTPSSLCLHSRNNGRRTLVVAEAAKPLKPLTGNVPPNSHGLTIVEKRVEDVKTVVDKSQSEAEVEVSVKIKVLDGKNRMLQKKFTATIVADQEEAKASESDNAE